MSVFRRTLLCSAALCCGILTISQPSAADYSTKEFQIAALQFLPDLTDSEFGWHGSIIDDARPVTNSCEGYDLTSCPANAVCSECAFAKKYKKTGCKKGYKDNGETCTPLSCDKISSSYLSAVSSGQVCSIVPNIDITCYNGCRAVSCAAYTLTSCPSNANCSPCPDCEATSTQKGNCGSSWQKVTSCKLTTQKVNAAATECVNKSDTCQSGYSKDCGEDGVDTTKPSLKTEMGSTCYFCKPPAVPCVAPRYKNSQNACVLWDDVAALATTCSELVTSTKNANITGNILVWGTIDCKETPITLSPGQNLVGRGFFKNKYPEAVDSDTNKASKITWNFTSSPVSALTLEHNAKLSDLTLSAKSSVAGKWVSPLYETPTLLEVANKDNLTFNNVDLFGDMSASESKALTMINATTGKITLKGKNALRFKNATKANSDGRYYVSNSTTYMMKGGTINIGADASLDISYVDGGSYYGFLDTNLNMSDNAQFTLNMTDDFYTDIFDTASSLNYKGQLITMRGTSKMTVKLASNQSKLSDGIPIFMYDNSTINFKGGEIVSGDYKNGTAAADALNMNNNSVANVNGSTGGRLVLNDSATLRIKSPEIRVVGYGNIALNGDSKFIIKQNTNSTDSYGNANYGVFSSTSGPTLSGNAKLYIEANRHIFEDARFQFNSSSAKIYARQTNTSYRIFGAGGSNPEVWLYKTAANSPFYIETPGQNGYNGAEDDGLYLLPALGISASDGASICSHMTSSYSSSKINRDLGCWTHDKDANPNNNDYLKGRQCDRCSTGYKLTGVTYVPKSDSRFTSTKADFDKEMTALTSNMNF